MNYTHRTLTDSLVVLRDGEAFKKDVEALMRLGFPFEYKGHFGDGRLNFDVQEQDGKHFVWVGGHDISVDVILESYDIELPAFPPEDWTETQKLGHAETYGYPICLPSLIGEDGCFNVIGFLQHHMDPKAEPACILGTGEEGLRGVDAWVAVFDKEHCESTSLAQEAKRLEQLLLKKRSKKGKKRGS